jgi:putative transcriptional regulator
MSEYFESIKRGLEEAIEYSRGNLKAKSFKVHFEPVPEYAPADIKRIRVASGMTQIGFAEFLGVTKKAVEAWESGSNKPNGSARRLMSVAERDPAFPMKYYSIDTNRETIQTRY